MQFNWNVAHVTEFTLRSNADLAVHLVQLTIRIKTLSSRLLSSPEPYICWIQANHGFLMFIIEGLFFYLLLILRA